MCTFETRCIRIWTQIALRTKNKKLCCGEEPAVLQLVGWKCQQASREALEQMHICEASEMPLFFFLSSQHHRQHAGFVRSRPPPWVLMGAGDESACILQCILY
jgi:hypothetical protein